MITRRDKLLVRPWEQRRYENHRRKVQSAMPAIDVGPPANRVHVFSKLKKQQKEVERCDKIEQDNLKLLQRLRSLMSSTRRVDNTWTKSQPNFLNRVTLYNTKPNRLISQKTETPSPNLNGVKDRKSRCSACTPKKIVPSQIPEERVPWEPMKPIRSRSLPLKRVQINEESIKIGKQRSTLSKRVETKPTEKQRSKSCNRNPIQNVSSLPSIILKRGDLHLAVIYPPDTVVQFKDGYSEKFLGSPPCYCKAIKI